MATADAWPRSGARPGRATIEARTGRPPMPGDSSRQSSRRGAEPPRRPRIDVPRGGLDDRYQQPSAAQPRAAVGPADRRASSRPAEQSGGRVRGIVAVLGMFLVTLAGAAVDSFLGIGLGTVTLIALVSGTALAALVVRRRDLVSVVVAPPLVFLAVTAANVGLAPSANLSLPTIATLLVRGFPAMGIATAVALVLALIRAAARR